MENIEKAFHVLLYIITLKRIKIKYLANSVFNGLVLFTDALVRNIMRQDDRAC